MRPIKFRAFDKEKNIIVVVTRMYLPFWVRGYIPDNLEYDFYEDWCGDYQLNNFEIMQFTGFLDKNEKEVYEGDIVKSIQRPFECYKPEEMMIFKIEYSNSLLKLIGQTKDGFAWKELILLRRNCEIIGNIYQNPELLTENKQ